MNRWSTRSPGRPVQDILTARRNGQRSRIHNHYLKSTVYCIECGRRLIIQNTRSKSGRVYQYFICSRRQGDDCLQRKALPVADVEKRVEDAYRTITLTEQQRQGIEDIALAKLRRQHALHAQRREELENETRKIDSRREKLLELYYEDVLPRESLLKHQRKLNSETTRIQQELAAVQIDDNALEQKLRIALDLLQHSVDHYLQADEATREQLNRALFKRILLGPQPDQIWIELNDVYDELINAPTPHTKPKTG
ncbi:zinc ribbon domain-containing protein [Humibacter albus]|uniref:zinc ribbon domain-containing protein n=1 Tax=Humibacter albus TaxID=427754 RepID=UPI000684C7FF|nr:zinc ribbon domain-containing protein [Humibacter albus]